VILIVLVRCVPSATRSEPQRERRQQVRHQATTSCH